jgi:outer membrane lipoprotein SlyB
MWERKKVLLLLVLAMVVFASCVAYEQQTPAVRGGAVGAGVGGLAGALLDSNPWRGGIIGGALGAVLGATLGQLSDQAAREAAQSNRPVEYRTEDGRGRYYAEPQGYDAHTKCHKVHEKVWEEGRLVRDQVKEVCEGTKREEGRY